MEAQLLRTFVTVARLGSFSAAAAELGYTQAAVSQQVAALENELKTRLLNRRPVTPTEPGARLLEHAEPILLRLDAARADVTRMAKAPAATLHIGVTPLAGATSALPVALAQLRAQMPRLIIAVKTTKRGEAVTEVARGCLDLALIDGLTAPGDPVHLADQVPVTATGLSESPVVVVLPPNHPLMGRTSLALADLADARWIAADNVAPPLDEIGRHAGAGAFTPAIRYAGQDVTTLIRLASAGHGLTLLPEAVVRLGAVTSVSVTTPRLCHRTELVHATLPRHSPAATLAELLNSPATAARR